VAAAKPRDDQEKAGETNGRDDMKDNGKRDERNRVRIFDTTLRDGEQSPGISLNKGEKLEIAHQLARLGVDVIEAGFPIASPGDFEAVQAIAREVHGPVIAGLARANAQDVDAAWNAIRESERPRIHTFISTSDIHIEHQLQTTREDVKGQARAAVVQARSLCDDVEFSPMDATRADLEFTAEVIQISLDEGATTINVPDTVGYSMPDEHAAMWRELYRLVPDLAKVTTSVHCHDDLGLAVANSFAGVLAGCRQVECAINGIGERAGNASLEEIVMLIRTREDAHGLWTGIDTREIARTSRLVSRLTGYQVPPNKAIVGRNAFAHESGIHQDGVLKERTTYEIMDARTIGLDQNQIVLGKHSGRHALRKALEELGFEVTGAALNTAFQRFKEVADKKKRVTALDLEAIVSDEMRQAREAFRLESFDVEAASFRAPHASVRIGLPNGEVAEGSFTGDGPVDAFFSAINAATGHEARLKEYHVSAVTGGRDALGEVTVMLELNGALASGQGVSTDILEASGRAYLRALANALAAERGPVAEAERHLSAADEAARTPTP
jgi:2-isopropylmalate synthase